jgi:hypothetical protein
LDFPLTPEQRQLQALVRDVAHKEQKQRYLPAVARGELSACALSA